MRSILVTLLLLFSAHLLEAQVVYIATKRLDADLAVYITQHRYEASNVIYVTDSVAEARSTTGAWYFTSDRSSADLVIYRTRKGLADCVVYYTNDKDQVTMPCGK